MLIPRVLANAMALKAAYDDLPSDDADAATEWKQIVDATRANFEDETRKTNRAPSAALAEYLLSG
jgi:hypothetical protein